MKDFITRQDYAGLLAWVNETHHLYFKKWQVKFNKAFQRDPNAIPLLAHELLKDLRAHFYGNLQKKLGDKNLRR